MQTTSSSSSVELTLYHDNKDITPETAHHLDVLRWRFKGPATNEFSDLPFIFFEDGRLWANTSTPRKKERFSGGANPIINSSNHPIFARTSLPPTAVEYGPPYFRREVDVEDTRSSGQYVVRMSIGEHDFWLQVDTGSDISWICGFDRLGNNKPKFDPAMGEQLELAWVIGSFAAKYSSGEKVGGPVCHGLVTFASDPGNIEMAWSFGVATSRNYEVIRNPVNDGVLALSFKPISSDQSNFFEPEHLTFMQYLLRNRYVDHSFYICFNIGRRATGKLIFGELPDLGAGRKFVFKDSEEGVDDHWALQAREISVVVGGKTAQMSLRSSEKKNFALFDIGTEYIYFPTDVADWIYAEICGDGGYTNTNGTYYITRQGAEKLQDSFICLDFGQDSAQLPAKFLQGTVSFTGGPPTFIGAIQGMGGNALQNERFTYNIYGAAFFRQVWVAFEAYPSCPRIAILPKTSEEDNE